MNEEKTTEFIRKSKSVHGDRFDYSAVVYEKWNKKVSIHCRVHGEFLQTPNNHLNGNGCPRCSKVGRISPEEFIDRARLVWGETVDYSSCNYTKMKGKVLLKCCEHDTHFEQKLLKEAEEHRYKVQAFKGILPGWSECFPRGIIQL